LPGAETPPTEACAEPGAGAVSCAAAPEAPIPADTQTEIAAATSFVRDNGTLSFEGRRG